MLILTSPSTITYERVEPPPLTIEEKILAELPPVFLEIAKCESQNRQFKEDGTGLKSPTADYGYFQINEKVWDKDAQRMGLDYKNSFDDNLAMAVHIYNIQGLDAWVCYKLI